MGLQRAKMKIKNGKYLSLICSLLTVAAILILWTLAAAAVDSEYVLPTVGETLSAAVKMFADKTFYVAMGGTLIRVAIAFLLSFSIALTIAFASYKSEVCGAVFAPLIKIMRALPTVAVVLLLLFWTNSRVAPVIVTMLVVIPTLFTDLSNAFNGIDRDLTEMCKAFSVPSRERFLEVEFPQVLPSLLNSAGAGLSLNLKLMVAAEVLAQTARSAGYLLNTAKVYFEISEMLALVAVIIVAGVIVEYVFAAFAKKAAERL